MNDNNRFEEILAELAKYNGGINLLVILMAYTIMKYENNLSVNQLRSE